MRNYVAYHAERIAMRKPAMPPAVGHHAIMRNEMPHPMPRQWVRAFISAIAWGHLDKQTASEYLAAIAKPSRIAKRELNSMLKAARAEVAEIMAAGEEWKRQHPHAATFA